MMFYNNNKIIYYYWRWIIVNKNVTKCIKQLFKYTVAKFIINLNILNCVSYNHNLNNAHDKLIIYSKILTKLLKMIN